jgi:hypothetical protein
MADSKATRNSQSVNRLDDGGLGTSDHSLLTNRSIADQHPISAITNLQTSLDEKQATLVSGTNIKSINGVTLLGAGDLTISGTGAVDSVNGEVGIVVLDADDIAPSATRLWFTTSEQTKLSGIGTGAQLVSIVAGTNVTVDNTDPQNPVVSSAGGSGSTNLTYTASATNGVVVSDTGTDATIPAGSTTDASLMLPADKTKLNGVASGATANSADAFLLDRENHTGTQAAATITGLATVATTGAYSDLSGTPDLSLYATNNVAARVITGADTPTSADLNKKIRSNSASAHNITISDTLNTAAAVDDVILVQWQGVGTPSFVVSGSQTINDGTTAIPMTQRYQMVVITKVANNTWLISGAI